MRDELDDFIDAWLAPKPNRRRGANDNRSEAGMEFRAADKLKAIKREIALRRAAYPKWVKAGRITQAQSDYEVAIMEAIAVNYAREAEQVEITFGE